MKLLKALLLAGMLLSIPVGLTAQEKIEEKMLLGTWKMVINIEEELEEAEEELEENGDSFLEKIIFESVSGLVSGIIEELEIYMEFKPDGELVVTVDAFDEHETEYSNWFIDKKGRLFIEDTESFQSDEFWLYEKGMLVSYEERDGGLRRNNVYMVNIDTN